MAAATVGSDMTVEEFCGGGATGGDGRGSSGGFWNRKLTEVISFTSLRVRCFRGAPLAPSPHERLEEKKTKKKKKKKRVQFERLGKEKKEIKIWLHFFFLLFVEYNEEIPRSKSGFNSFHTISTGFMSSTKFEWITLDECPGTDSTGFNHALLNLCALPVVWDFIGVLQSIAGLDWFSQRGPEFLLGLRLPAALRTQSETKERGGGLDTISQRNHKKERMSLTKLLPSFVRFLPMLGCVSNSRIDMSEGGFKTS